MAKSVTFSPRAADRIVRAVRRVEMEPLPTLGGNGRGDGGRFDCWLKITGAGAYATNRFLYTVSVYARPDPDATAIVTGKLALNLHELGNSSTWASGYTIVTGTPQCGDVTAIKAVGVGGYNGGNGESVWVRALGKTVVDDDEVFWFDRPNIPEVAGA